MDAFEVLQTAIAPSMQAIKDNSVRKLNLATEAADRAYQERLQERRRQQQKSDEEEARKRGLRNQLSALMPPGVEVDPSMTEEQMTQAIAQRTRSRAIQYDQEDKQRALSFELDKASKLDDAKLQREAEQYGVPWDAGNKDAVRRAIAEKSATEKLNLSSILQQKSIDQARSSKDYQSLRNQLASIEVERDALTTQLALPEPMFDPNISPAESAQIYNEIARTPAVIDQFSKMKDGAVRLMALQRGDFQTATKGINDAERGMIVESLTSNLNDLEKRLMASKSATYQAGARSYIERLRTLPQRLTELDRRRSELFKIGDGTGVNIGLALRMEDPDVLTAEYMRKMQQQGQSMPQLNLQRPTQPQQSQPSGTPQAPSLPQPQAAAHPVNQNVVQGVIPKAISSAAQYVEPAYREATQGLGSIAKSADNLMTVFGNSNRDKWVNLFGGTPSTNTPAIDVVSPVMGAYKLIDSPFRLLNWEKDAPAEIPAP